MMEYDLYETAADLHGITGAASFSMDRANRYLLMRVLHGGTKGTASFIMLNPSTADARNDDPTIRRCIGFARRDGFGTLLIANLYARIATDPRELRGASEQPDAEERLNWKTAIENSDRLVLAWGALSWSWLREQSRVRIAEVHRLAELCGRRTWCLGRTLAGSPRHPLYVKKTQSMVPR